MLLEMIPGRRKSEVKTKEVLDSVTSVFIYGYGNIKETLTIYVFRKRMQPYLRQIIRVIRQHFSKNNLPILSCHYLPSRSLAE
jgi:hypothetical protein